MASIDAICKLLKPGDEVVSTNDLYGGTYRLFTKIFEGYGVKFTLRGHDATRRTVEQPSRRTPS